MLFISINNSSNIPLYKQIVKHITYLIDNEILKSGDKLPSTRNLAKQHHLNRNTIYKAYEELWSIGYIESKPGSYSVVRKRIKNVIEKPISKKQDIDWEKRITTSALVLKNLDRDKNKSQSGNNMIDFRQLSPDPTILPNEKFRKCINEILKSKKTDLLYYGEPEGYMPLRKFLEKHMQLHSINVNYSDIIITNGAQNALDLIARLLINPGDTIIIEKPTYSEAIAIFKYYQARIIEIPIEREGIDLEELSKVLQNHNPKLLYTMPNFQNPTGTTTGQEHREKLLELCESNQLPIIEDGFVEEMKYFGKNILPIKSMDKTGLVFYIGTFSKVLFPGIRLGWIASNTYCTQRFSEIKKATEISMNIINQAGIELFCERGLYEKQLRKIHSTYKKRMGVALKTLRDNLLNEHFNYTKPIGGYTIWFETNENYISEPDLIEKLYKGGVYVTGGLKSCYTKNNKTCFRISIAHRNEIEIELGMKRILQVLNSISN